MKPRTHRPKTIGFAFLALVILIGLGLLSGCRTYVYTQTTPDGMSRHLQITSVLSTTSVGELSIATVDGATVTLKDMTAQERATEALSAIAAGAAEGAGP